MAARFHPQPNIDGRILVETPYETFARSRQGEVDVLVGSNEGEGLYFVSGRQITAANMSEELKRDFPSFIVSLVGPKAPADDAAARAAFVAFEGNMRFGWNMWAWARLHSASGKGKTFLYRFSYARPGEEGASHGAEMAYVFDHVDTMLAAATEADRRLADTMATYWTNFAKTGDPNGAGAPEWPVYARSGAATLLIGEEIRAGVIGREQSLRAIDNLYRAVRILLKYGFVIAGGAVLLVLVLIWRVASSRRRPRARA